jgi:NADH-quinone oxidoreductase subunit N
MTFSMTDVVAVLPETIVMAGACLMLILDLFVPQGKKRHVGYFAIATVLFAAAYTYQLAGVETIAMAGMFALDNYAAYFKLVFYVSTVLAVMLSLGFVDRENMEHRGEYYALMLFALSGMMVMASGADLLTIYLGMELMALPIYVLVGYLKRDARSNEAAMKYVVLGAFSSAMLLYGISLVYGVTGTTSLSGVALALAAQTTGSAVLSLGIVLMAAGLCFKIAGFPFHIWAPDAYEGAPTTITAFMTVGAKAAAFAAILRVFIEALYPAYQDWQLVLSMVALGSMIYGNTVAIAQKNIKRMLAYSSIGHAGYALLGLIAGTGEGTSAVLFYMLVYAFMNMGAFGVVIMMKKSGSAGENIGDYRGLARTRPALALVMLIFMFSLTGIPPTAGFMGKFYVFMALIHSGKIALAVASILTSAIAAFFYIRIVLLMYMKDPEGEMDIVRSRPLYYVLGISLIAVLLLGILPGYFMMLAEKAALLL